MKGKYSQWALVSWCALLCGAGLTAVAQTSPSSSNRFEARGAVVYDRKTSLLWQRCSVGQQWRNGHCLGTAKTYTWDEARELDADGWRLPTLPELKSLVDLDRKNKHLSPVIDPSAFPDLPRDPNLDKPMTWNLRFTPNWWWASTALSSCISETRLGCGAYVDFDDDSNLSNSRITAGRETRLYVRLVRAALPEGNRMVTAGQTATAVSADGRFVMKGNEAFDRQTGLTWQRCDAGREVLPNGLGCSGIERVYTIAEARQLGGNGWRLPTLNDLLTIVDRKRKSPYINTTVFLDYNEQSGTYWTNTPYPNYPYTQIWCVHFSLASPDNCGPEDPRHARLVRKGP